MHLNGFNKNIIIRLIEKRMFKYTMTSFYSSFTSLLKKAIKITTIKHSCLREFLFNLNKN